MATELRSFSKINLGLAIGPVRPGGFHALTTVYQTLPLHDRVRVVARRAVTTRIRITTNHARVPTTEKNTAWRMVERALAALGTRAEVSLHIEKQLPVQGGLGAGSANAVAALLGLERELGQTLPTPERLRLAAEIGSDVPLFLLGGAVLGVGRGEEVYPLIDFPPVECVVAVPQVGVSTPAAFRDWDARHPPVPNPGADPLTGAGPASTLERLSRSIAAAWSEPHSSGVFLPRAVQGTPPLATPDDRRDLAETPLLALVHTGIANDFEEVVFPQHSLLREIKCLLAGSGLGRDHTEDGALYAGLSGSGATLFGLYRTAEAADRAAQRVRGYGGKNGEEHGGVHGAVAVFRTRTLPREEYWRTMSVEG